MVVTYHPQRVRRFPALRERRMEEVKRSLLPTLNRMMGANVPLQQQIATILPRAAEEEFLGVMSRDEMANREHLAKSLHTMDMNLSVHGGNIFDFALLAPLFSRTDVSDVDLTDVPVPYPAFYLHFGEGAGLAIKAVPGIHVEGAYVAQVKGERAEQDALVVIYVCNHPEWQRADRTTFGETLRRHTRIARGAILMHMTVGDGLAVTDGFDGDPEIHGDTAVMTSALRMVVNSLLYLASPDADVEDGYQDGAPEKLVNRANRGNVKAMRDLGRLGYTRVRMCGRHTVHGGEAGDPSGRQFSSHWRRGHWQRFAVGAGRSRREWRWVRPTLVNRDAGTAVEGRVYVVDPQGRASPSGAADA